MNWQWGISASLPEQFQELPSNLPPEISALEVPGEALDSADGCDLIHHFAAQKLKLAVCDLILPELARLIPGENRQLQNEFDHQFRARCRRAAQLNVREFSVNFDLERAVTDTEFKQALRALLARCAGVLEEFKLTLRMPCRLPRPRGEASVELVLQEVRNLLYPRFKLFLELHPHEPFAPGEPENSLRKLVFADEYRRLRFNSENGNLLTSAMLERTLVSFTPPNPARHILFLSPEHGVIDEAMLSAFTHIINHRNQGEENA